MPIGPYENFAGLRQHIQAEYAKKGKKKPSTKKINAITAGTADKIRPGWREDKPEGDK